MLTPMTFKQPCQVQAGTVPQMLAGWAPLLLVSQPCPTMPSQQDFLSMLYCFFFHIILFLLMYYKIILGEVYDYDVPDLYMYACMST